MAKVVWSDPALEQVGSILAFIALDKPEAARAVAARIVDATDHLERFVRLGRPIPEYPHESYRQVWVRPCWIYYRIDAGSVYIVHVRRGEKPLTIEDLLSDYK